MGGKKEKISPGDFKEIVDNLHDEIMVFDDDYRLVYLNNASMRHYGLTPKELIGKKFDALDEVYWGNSTLPDVYATGQTVAKRQITILGQDVITISTPILNEDGSIKYVAQNVNDLYYINEISKMEEKSHEITNSIEGTAEYFAYQSPQMQNIVQMVHKIKNITSPCLILGETGTGKSYIAKYIHQLSNRRSNPFVSINCACMNPNLIESELFGYKKGAFSGASLSGKKGLVQSADGGTLFLDEISELPYDLQAKLLYFIQEQEFIPLGSEKAQKVDVKIIAATNRNLKQMVDSNSFREDLFYRLNIFEITIPPLRERTEDITVLSEYFLEKFNKAHFRSLSISKNAMAVMKQYSWPGNIRELSHVLEKIVVLTHNKEIETTDLPKTFFELKEKSYVQSGGDSNLDEMISDVEQKIILEYYKKYKSSIQVAKALGISQSRAYRLIKKYITAMEE